VDRIGASDTAAGRRRLDLDLDAEAVTGRRRRIAQLVMAAPDDVRRVERMGGPDRPAGGGSTAPPWLPPKTIRSRILRRTDD